MKVLSVFLLLFSIPLKAQVSNLSTLNWARADSIAALYQGEDLYNLPLLAYQLTSPLDTQVEKFRAIYTWVSTNIENDYDYYLLNKRKREKLAPNSAELTQWNQDFGEKVFKKLIKEQKTICTGYAYLIKELANLVGIKCEIIDGYGRTITANVGGVGVPNHSWNAVWLENKWYLCDATWSSGGFLIQAGKATFMPEYYDGYFLPSPELFAKNHYPFDKTWLLTTQPLTLEAFLNAPIVYKYAFGYEIVPQLPQKKLIEVFKNEKVSFLMKAGASVPIEEIELELVMGSQVTSVVPSTGRTAEGLLELQHVCTKLGQYDVHLKIGAKYIFTYILKVKKK